MNNASTMTCPNCHGSKRIAKFAHIDNGTCFQCGGAGVIEIRNVPVHAARAPKSYDRAWYILECSRVIAAARSQGRHWLSMDDADDVDHIRCTRVLLAKAPADVAERARKALSVAVSDPAVRAALLAA